MSYAFFPFLAAACYGIGYLILEKAVAGVNLATLYFTGASLGIVISICYAFWQNETISYSFAKETPSLLLILISATLATGMGWIFTTNAVKNTSAVYAAMGEVSYPLFTVLFAFLFFGVRYFDWTVLLGGALIMIGSFILVYGQIRTKTG